MKKTFDRIIKLLFGQANKDLYDIVMIICTLVLGNAFIRRGYNGYIFLWQEHTRLISFLLVFALAYFNNIFWKLCSKGNCSTAGIVLVLFGTTTDILLDVINYASASFAFRMNIAVIMVQVAVFYIVGQFTRDINEKLSEEDTDSDGNHFREYYSYMAQNEPISFKFAEYQEISDFYDISLPSSQLECVKDIQRQRRELELMLYHNIKYNSQQCVDGECPDIDWKDYFLSEKEKVDMLVNESKSEYLIYAYVYMAYFSMLDETINPFTKDQAKRLLLDHIKKKKIMPKHFSQFVLSELKDSCLSKKEQITLVNFFEDLMYQTVPKTNDEIRVVPQSQNEWYEEAAEMLESDNPK
jgi:hypothetical protein